MNRNSIRCYDPSRRFKPQWANAIPKGFRPEDFFIPFTFQVPADGAIHVGFPWRLDDDVPYVLWGIVFGQIGLGQQAVPSSPFALPVNSPAPGLCRITDTAGNPLSPATSPPVLALGVASQSGFGNVNAFGFPIEPPVMCSPGGVLIFDFQLSSNGVPYFLILAGVAESILFESNTFPANSGLPFISITLNDTGIANTPLAVASAGIVGVTFTVVVTLQDDAGGLLVTTYADLMALLNADPAVSAVFTSRISGTNPAEILTTGVNDGAHLFSGGPSTVVTLQGTLLGSKLFTDC